MPKTKISEFSATPGNNTDIDGINIAEGCAPSGINDAIRELMAQLKDFQAGTAGDSFNGPVGTSTAAAGAFTTLSATGVATFSSGTAGAPAITTTGDTNTGIFFPAADTVAASVGGTEGLRLTSTGLGVGTSSPSFLLHASASSAAGTVTSGVRNTATDGNTRFALGNNAGVARATISLNNNSDEKMTIGPEGSFPMLFQTNGTERLRLDSSGNLGLGVTPSAWSLGKAIEVGTVGNSIWGIGSSNMVVGSNIYYASSSYKYANTAAASAYQQAGGVHYWYNAASGTAGNTISLTQAMTLDSSGRLGIGTTSPATAYRMSLTGDGSTMVGGLALTSGGNAAYIGQVGATSADCEYWNAANGYIRFGTNNSERARITSGGDLLVNRTSTLGTAKFVVEADTTTANPMTVSNSRSTAATDYSILFYRNASLVGSVQTSLTATSYVTSSDYRLKENIQPMTGALAKVAALKPVTYKWKATGGEADGFIAHELAEVCPQAVTGEKDAVDADGNPVYQGIDTSFLVATLTAALQELNAKVESLTTELNALKGT